MNFCLRESNVGWMVFYFIIIVCWIAVQIITFHDQKDYRPELENNFIKFLFNKDEPYSTVCNLLIIVIFIFNIVRVICTLKYGFAPEG